MYACAAPVLIFLTIIFSADNILFFSVLFLRSNMYFVLRYVLV